MSEVKYVSTNSREKLDSGLRSTLDNLFQEKEINRSVWPGGFVQRQSKQNSFEFAMTDRDRYKALLERRGTTLLLPTRPAAPVMSSLFSPRTNQVNTSRTSIVKKSGITPAGNSLEQKTDCEEVYSPKYLSKLMDKFGAATREREMQIQREEKRTLKSGKEKDELYDSIDQRFSVSSHQRLEVLAVNRDEDSVNSESKHDIESEGGKLVDERDDVLDKLVNRFRSNLVVTKSGVDTKYFVNDFEEVAGRVIIKAANEFEKKMNEIKILKNEKESAETNFADLKTELIDHRNRIKDIFADKSKEMEAIVTNLRCFESEKDENSKDIAKVTEEIKLLELKKKVLAKKQNKIDSRIRDFLVEKRSIQTYLYTENKKATKDEEDINNKLDALAMNMKDIEDKIANAKHFQILGDAAPPKTNHNSMMIQFLENTIETKAKQLECPVCFNIAEAPIFSCSESHLVCGSCRPKLRLCPECRLPYKEQKRHRYAEIMAKELDNLRQQKNKLETSNDD